MNKLNLQATVDGVEFTLKVDGAEELVFMVEWPQAVAIAEAIFEATTLDPLSQN